MDLEVVVECVVAAGMTGEDVSLDSAEVGDVQLTRMNSASG